MRWLIWKEYRQQRLVLGMALAILLLPYAIVLCLLLYFWCLYYASYESERLKLTAFLEFGAIASQANAFVAAALLGGNAMAVERQDRSVEFLAYQPIARWRALLAKISLPALILLGSTILSHFVLARHPVDLQFAAACFCAFGVAWLTSSFLSSPTLAIAAGFFCPIILWFLLDWIYGGGFLGERAQWFYAATGVLGLAGGSERFLHRVGP